MAQPKTCFTRADDVNIAYQVIGDGPVDLVYVWGGWSNIEVAWEEPSLAAFLRRLSEFTRLILFDRRGCGLSDRGGSTVTPTLEERMEDVLAVLDAVGSERASILGVSEGGVLAAWLAATHPERVTSIIAYGTVARVRKDAAHPWGWMDDETFEPFVEQAAEDWGMRSPWGAQLWAPSMAGDERYMEWAAKFKRQSVSRGDVRPMFWAAMDADAADVWPAVRVPTLVLHRRDDRLVPVDQGRWISEHVPDARFVELAGIDHLPFIGDAEEILAAVEEFLVGSRTTHRAFRKLLTVMSTDIANSTMLLSSLGDGGWREVVAAHDRTIRDHLARFDGAEMKQHGEGFLAVFDGPARAIRCAIAILDAAEQLGLSLRIGIHTGECEVAENEVQGMTVHITARLTELAAPGEILTSRTVRDLVAGSGIRFGEEREVDLEGIPAARTVCSVLRRGATPEAVRRLARGRTNIFRRDGEYWTVAYDGRVVTLRDSKGLRDIARLLASPARELHVLDLIAEGAPRARTVSRSEARGAGLDVEQPQGDVLIDHAARAGYRRRMVDLQEEIDHAESQGDTVAATVARKELDAIAEQLSAAYGVGGKGRRTPDHAERARKTVTRRVRDALTRIERAHPGLGRHLNASLRTGAFCSYEPEHPLTWNVSMR